MVIDNGYILELKLYAAELEFLNHIEDDGEMLEKIDRIEIVTEEIRQMLYGNNI